MASEVVGGAVEGARAGATIGTAIPVVGTIAGAVIGGVIGAVAGIFSNKKKKAAKRAGKKAQAIARQQQAMQLALQRRDLIRQARANRAIAVAAGGSEDRTSGSGTAGAAGSINSQLEESLNYFDAQVSLDYQANEYRKKAGKYAGQAADLNSVIGSLDSIGTLGANVIGALNTPKKK